MESVMKAFEAVGRPVWIALMVIGFIWFWPVGLAILAYLVWTGKLGARGAGAGVPWSVGFWSSGNAAFDRHQQEARDQLDKEIGDFREFIKRKLTDKDQAEFAEFSASRK